ncbi:MAG: recombinase zinc beta ribbon domain-containing protein [Rhodospirillaceae bacterium]|nr:recombinase zinc beta ribbon domain-containing protein [Rhodospirillaceae bacterium]
MTAHREHQKTCGANTRPGKTPTYLLSGILKCGACGADYIKANKTHYRCSAHVNRGKEICSNGVSVRKDVAEASVLHALKTDLFEENSFSDFKKEVRRVLNERIRHRNTDHHDLKRQIASRETEITNILNFVKQGNAPASLLAELHQAETDREKLRAALETHIPSIDAVEDLLSDALGRYAVMAYDLESFAARDVSKARNMIAALVGGRITLHATAGGGLQAELQGSYDGLIELVKENPGGKARVSKLGMVAGAGFEPTTFRL